MRNLIFWLCIAACCTAQARSALPKDIRTFVGNADACEHFAGEYDGELDKQRKREVERAIVKHCQAAQKQMKLLERKYKDDPQMVQVIRNHAYDAVVSFR